MKAREKIFAILLFIAIVVFSDNVAYAGEQKMSLLDYQAQLNSDGSMDVVETWDIYVSETNTLFKDFKLDSSKYSGITNVKVKDIKAGVEFRNINEEMYHVTKYCYYALPISGNKFEIAWGVGMDNSSANLKYQISYTVKDAVTVYNDCSELYWQFIGTDNGIPVDRVTGTIKLPSSVSNFSKLRVWAHGPLNGEIYKDSADTVTFFVNNLKSETMVETRVVCEEEMFSQSTKKVTKNKLSSILAEEQKWADEANNKRTRATSIKVVIGFVYVFLMILFGKKILKYSKELKQFKKIKHNIDVGEYFRDIPREKDSTPAEAAFLYYAKNNKFNINESRVFAATLLQLCLKGFISFENGDKKDIKINFSFNLIDIEEEKGPKKLKLSEERILKLLKEVANPGEKYVTMKQIKNFAKSNYTEFGLAMNALEKNARTENIAIGNYNGSNEKILKSYTNTFSGYVCTVILLLMFGIGFILIPVLVEMIICAIIISKICKTINVLTEQGETERQQWLGLKKYMEDFSMLNDREIPDLILWEKYLVYATTFGIADKVVKQLKVVYPEIMDSLDTNTYSYMYLMSDTHFIGNLEGGVSKAYSSYQSASSETYSSGSGGGGGFSGGGGGRRWRWPEWAEDKKA